MAYFRTSDGCSLYYETIGFEFLAPAVVFLNGTLQTTLYWKTIARSLQPRFRSLLYDARGQGESEAGDLPLSLDLHLDDLSALMRHVGVGPVFLVGLSHGALLGYAMARKQPQSVNRAVLCSIGIRASIRARMIVRSWSDVLAAGGMEALACAVVPHVFGEAFLSRNQKILPRIAATLARRNRKAAVAAHLSAMAAYPRLRSLLAPLTVPALIICGTDDPLVNVSGAAEAAEKSGAQFLKAEGIGHSIAAEAPQWFGETILGFFSDR
ncbi:alpha/beta hydrolase [Desulfosarcina sp. OttesenSCG-928-A07]|nr:alpha/beta hydrolase [Desulfosarcina sp. OttesenSCG-928-G17]MDL2330153.1 alpha/beta hydrolase [Desulfosarcina sp. OttesenSCG-928-A07]